MKSKEDFCTEIQYIKYLRSYYAGLALQGMSKKFDCNSSKGITHVSSDASEIAHVAFNIADKMILQLNNSEDGKTN